MNAVIENPNGIACWNWNGYSSQWVHPYNTRQEVIESVLRQHRLLRRDIRNGERFNVEVLEDGEFITVRTVYEYEYYGWRTATNYYTNRPGKIVEDYDEINNETIYNFVSA